MNGTKPELRCGSSLHCYFNSCLLFGGVADYDSDGIGTTASAFLKSKTPETAKMRSVFFNDLHRFDLQKLKWFPVEIKSNKSASVETGPSARMNAAIVVKNGILYVYGGLRELDEKKQVTSL